MRRQLANQPRSAKQNDDSMFSVRKMKLFVVVLRVPCWLGLQLVSTTEHILEVCLSRSARESLWLRRCWFPSDLGESKPAGRENQNAEDQQGLATYEVDHLERGWHGPIFMTMQFSVDGVRGHQDISFDERFPG